MKYHFLVLSLIGLLLINIPFADAHKTTGADENHSFETAFLIEDHTLSRVSFQELEPNKQNYYAFEGLANQKFFMEMVIPKDSRTAFFTPEIVFIGTPSQIVNISKQLHNPVCTMDHSMASDCSFKVKQIGYKFNDPNADFPIPVGYRGLLVSYDGELPSEEHYEPFSQTTFYQRQGVEFTLPETSWYWIVVYDDDFEVGDNRYALSTGYIEDWGILSLIDFAKSWIDAKIFTNDSTSILIVISAIGITAFAVMYRSVNRE